MAAFTHLLDPDSVPVHVLFPEAYAKTSRMIVRDFVLLGGFMAGAIVGIALLFG